VRAWAANPEVELLASAVLAEGDAALNAD